MSTIDDPDPFLAVATIAIALLFLSIVIPIKVVEVNVHGKVWDTYTYLKVDTEVCESEPVVHHSPNNNGSSSIDISIECHTNTQVLSSASLHGDFSEEVMYPPAFPIPFMIEGEAYNERSLVTSVIYSDGGWHSVPSWAWRTEYFIGQECKAYRNIYAFTVFDRCEQAQGR